MGICKDYKDRRRPYITSAKHRTLNKIEQLINVSALWKSYTAYTNYERNFSQILPCTQKFERHGITASSIETVGRIPIMATAAPDDRRPTTDDESSYNIGR